MSITVANARTALENRKQDITDVSTQVFLSWCNNINNYAYKILQSIDPDRYITTQTISVISGTNTYSLPSGFQNVNQLGTGLFDVDDDGTDTDISYPITGNGSSDKGYYLTLSSLILTPVPEASDTLKLKYIPTLSSLTGDTSTFIIPDRFLEHIVNALDVQYSIWDEDVNAEMLNDQRFMRSLSDMTEDFKQTPLVYAIQDFSSIY